MIKLHELQESRQNAVVAMRALADLAEREKRELTPEEDTKFDTFKTSLADLDKKISRAQILAEAERAAPAIIHGRIGDGSFEDRAADFSIVKAIAAHMPRDIGGGGVDAGFEREISAEVARRSGRTFQGIAVPDQVFQEKRTLLAGSSAAPLVPTTLRPDLFVDRLRAALVTQRLGATVLDNMVGTVDIPRQTGSSSGQWVAEDGSLSADDAAFDDIVLAPKTVGALTSYSRRTLLNASPSIEQIIRNDLAQVIANAIDLKAMVGDGTSNTPVGIIHATGVPSLDLSTASGFPAGASWDRILTFISTIENANADGSAMGWAMNPVAVKKLRTTLKLAGGSTPEYLMEEPNNLAGYPVATTGALPGNTTGPVAASVIFGDWSSLLIAYWTGIDLLINPYETTAYAKGRVLVRAMRDVDVQVRHPESFAFTSNMPCTAT